jgi:hypothetical protein
MNCRAAIGFGIARDKEEKQMSVSYTEPQREKRKSRRLIPPLNSKANTAQND